MKWQSLRSRLILARIGEGGLAASIAAHWTPGPWWLWALFAFGSFAEAFQAWRERPVNP